MSRYASSETKIESNGKTYSVWGYRPDRASHWIIDRVTVFYWATDRFGLPVKRSRHIWRGFGNPSKALRKIMDAGATALAARDAGLIVEGAVK